MFGEHERVTVRELMTSNPEHVAAGATVETVHEWLDERGYTAAPVAREEPPYLYVTADDVDEAMPEAAKEPVYKHAERIELDDLLAPDLGFEAILAELAERQAYFVGWHGEVTGILTRADLNRPPAHAFLYTRIGELEMRLRDVVAAEADWEGTLATIPADRGGHDTTEYDLVREEYEEYSGADLQLRPIDYTTFWQLQTVVEHEEAVVDLLPFADADAAADALHRFRELRNQVAHYGNVVHNVDTEYLDSGRNVHQLEETYAELVETLDALRSWADDETGGRPVGVAEE